MFRQTSSGLRSGKSRRFLHNRYKPSAIRRIHAVEITHGLTNPAGTLSLTPYRIELARAFGLSLCIAGGLLGGIAPAQIRMANSPRFPDDLPQVGVAADAKAKKSPEDFEKRLKELEDQLAEQAKEQAKKEEQAEQREKLEAEEAKQKPTFELNGRIHMDYWAFPRDQPGIGFLEHPDPSQANYGEDPEDRFEFRRIRLEMSGDIPENMYWRMQVDFGDPSDPTFKDVYLGWRGDGGQRSFQIGNQKLPLGLDALDSSRYTVFAERPLINAAFVENSRRVGAAFYGYTNDELFNWAYGVFNLEDVSGTGTYVGDSLQLGGYGRLASTPWYERDGRDYLHLALAGAVAFPDGDAGTSSSADNAARFRSQPQARTDSYWFDTGTIVGANSFEILGTEGRLNLGPLQFTGETMVNYLQRDASTPGAEEDLVFYGFYGYVSYFVTGEYLPHDRTSGTMTRVTPHRNFFLFDRLRGCREGGGWGAWQIAARYDYIDLTDDDITGGVGNHFTLGLNWHWSPYAKMQSNLIFGDIDQRGPVGGYDGGSYSILGTRLMAEF